MRELLTVEAAERQLDSAKVKLEYQLTLGNHGHLYFEAKAEHVYATEDRALAYRNATKELASAYEKQERDR